jgi:tetratricopeptide (TPR) repeat protein
MRIRHTRELLLAAALGAVIANGSHAQDGSREAAAEGSLPAVDAGADAELLLTRGTSTWRNYVWSLDRPRLEHGLAELERARELAGGRTTFTHLYLIAFGHLVLGNEEPGRAAAAAVRARAPDYPPVLLLDAFESIVAGESDEALMQLDAYVDAIESAPPDPGFGTEFRFLAYLHRGAHRYDQGLHGEAAQDLRTAVRITREADRVPANTVLLRLARAHQNLDEHGAAEELIREMLRRDPGNADLYHNMGLLEGTQKQLPEARSWYERAVARRRNLEEAHGKLAFLAWRDADVDAGELRRMRRHLAAYRALARQSTHARTLADVESGRGTYWLSVARHRVDAGREREAAPAYARALRHFEAALEHEPGCVRALNSIIQIGAELAWPEERLGPYRERMDAILRLDEGAPESVRSAFC